MVFKIHTSKHTFEVFQKIGASEYLQPFVLAKLSLSLAIKSKEPLKEQDYCTDNNGLELNRQTITGEYDVLFKSLIEMKEKRHLDDEEYFQKYMKAYLDKGASLLESSFRYGGDFLTHLLDVDKDI